jgi:ABC-type Mn2+/Zn2+ transport system ATPase subunit
MIEEPARIDIEHVSLNYDGKPVLEDINVQIPEGIRVAVVGPNGAGKSTLFKVLVGEIPVQGGYVSIHCQPLGIHRDCVAYVPQREEVDWHFPVTVGDVVMMGRFGHLGWLARPSQIDYDVVARSMQEIGISDLAQNPISDLSGGQQQRVFLARALAQEPHIFLLDEPFNGVDAPTQDAIFELLENLKKQQVTTMVSTHDMNLAKKHFDRVILINKRLVAYGTPDQVFTRQHIQQAFTDRVMIVDGHAINDDCCGPQIENHQGKKR